MIVTKKEVIKIFPTFEELEELQSKFYDVKQKYLQGCGDDDFRTLVHVITGDGVEIQFHLETDVIVDYRLKELETANIIEDKKGIRFATDEEIEKIKDNEKSLTWIDPFTGFSSDNYTPDQIEFAKEKPVTKNTAAEIRGGADIK